MKGKLTKSKLIKGKWTQR